jgi:hypothetical protein
MAFIGNSVQNQGFTPAIDYFNGNGVTVTFTLSRPIASVAQVIVAVDNVIQNPSSAFGVVGNSITFTSAPLSGTNNIWVEYTSLITTYQGISQDPTVIGDIRATGGYLAEGDFGNSFIDGNLIDYVTGRGRFTVGELDDITFYHGGTSARSEMMDLYHAGGAKIYGTTALTIPVGTTGERPGTPATGMIRMNSTTGSPEWYSSTASSWVNFGDGLPYSVSYLVVAGGGGGGADEGGGGGAGGLLTSTTSVNTGNDYSITVGAGGAGSSTPFGNRGASGSSSVFSSITTIGGGGGGNGDSSPVDQRTGASGGSGGGGGQLNSAGGSGTSGQGFAGGSGSYTAPAYNGGGGGGAGAVGGNSNGTQAGNGGTGVASSISGSANTYGGGGGAGSRPGGTAGTGGAGGGGNGGANASGSNATTNTGGGGGSSGVDGGGTGGNGGSGIVIISYAGAQRGTGGTVTSSGGNTIHTFTSSGTYTA